MDKVIARIERQSGIDGLASILAERIEPTDLQSLLLAVYRERARRRSPASVLHDYETNRFVRPSPVPPSRFLEWERVALSALPEDFEAMTLSPLCPLATCSAVAAIDPIWAVATARNTEVVSDATNVLALECAVRRRRLLRDAAKLTVPVHLAACHRVVRPQKFDGPHMMAHFGLFVMCSAGRDVGSHAFELSTLTRHATCHLRALRSFLGPSLPLKVTLSNLGSGLERATVESRIGASLNGAFDLTCDFDATRTSRYYRDLAFRIDARTTDGHDVNLVDGGSVDWTQTLLSDRKERLIISGLGSERVCSAFD